MDHVKILPEHPGKWAAVFLITAIGLVGIYDIFAIFSGGKLHTASYYLQMWSHLWPIIPFGVGLLLGHLFLSS